MTPDMIAALAGKRKSATAFFEIDFPSGTRRMLLGSGEVAWGANTFKGYDATFGSIIGGDSLAEDVTGQAPNTSITVQVASTATKADIASADVQLSPVKIWLAAIGFDASNHFIAVPDPELVFDGFVDQATSSLDNKKDQLDYTLISGFDYFFEDSEGQRLSDGFHESVWPGEKGLANVSGVTRKVYWGTYGPGGFIPGSGSGGGPGGTYCVSGDSLVLMADGSEKAAAHLEVGDRVWTAHQLTGEFDAFGVSAVQIADEDILSAAAWPDATADHRFGIHENGGIDWFAMRDIGTPARTGPVAKITVAEAHTYMARHPAPGSPWRLCHNIKLHLPV